MLIYFYHITRLLVQILEPEIIIEYFNKNGNK